MLAHRGLGQEDRISSFGEAPQLDDLTEYLETPEIHAPHSIMKGLRLSPVFCPGPDRRLRTKSPGDSEFSFSMGQTEKPIKKAGRIGILGSLIGCRAGVPEGLLIKGREASTHTEVRPDRPEKSFYQGDGPSLAHLDRERLIHYLWTASNSR